MKLLRGNHPHSRPRRPTVVTVGNFDGVHLGHQQLLRALLTYARQKNCETAVVLFEPQPREFFQGEAAPPRLFTLRDKVVHLRDLGIDWVWVKTFNGELAAQTPRAFVEDCLVQGLAAQHVVVGDDFRFGAKRAGDLELLQALGPTSGFSAEGTGSFLSNEQRVSSTLVRAALQADDFRLAEQLLGRPYSMTGKVVYGQQLGRQLGFPTANIRMGQLRRPVQGVYRVRVRVNREGDVLPGIANVGVKPSFEHLGAWLEVHILDRTLDLYGQKLEVEFLDKVRPARRFDSLAALKGQIEKDTAWARAAFVQ